MKSIETALEVLFVGICIAIAVVFWILDEVLVSVMCGCVLLSLCLIYRYRSISAVVLFWIPFLVLIVWFWANGDMEIGFYGMLLALGLFVDMIVEARKGKWSKPPSGGKL